MADRIVREKERRELTGLCRTTAYMLERRKQFPRRVILTGARVGWKLSELQQWIESRRPAGEAA
jgi:prophage regulatory protein